MSAVRLALALTASTVTLLHASQASAQVQPQGAAVLTRACMGKGGQMIGETDLAEAMLIEAQISPSDFIRSVPVPPSIEVPTLGQLGPELIRRIRLVNDWSPTGRSPREVLMLDAVQAGIPNLEQQLNSPSPGLTVDRGNRPSVALFTGSAPTWRLTCKEQDPPRQVTADPPAPPRFAIRETPEELWLTDSDERAEAGAFSVGLERTRTTLDNGTRKTTTDFTIDGTAGVRLTSDTSRNLDVFLFGTYNLERSRVRPRPTLGPGESEGDGDTNVLALGFDAHFGGFLGGFPLDANLQTSMLFDFANDASRFRLRAVLTPRRIADIGLCGINYFIGDRFRSRCVVSGEIESAWVTRRGTTELGAYDTFLAIGGRAGIEFFLPKSPGNKNGFLASLTYRLLPVIHGPSDDIERFEASLSHRFWTSSDVGIDVGFTYIRGTNALSFVNEDKLTFGVGIIY